MIFIPELARNQTWRLLTDAVRGKRAFVLTLSPCKPFLPTRCRPGAAGVSPPCDREPRLQRHFRNYSRDCLLCTDERRCNHGSETTGGLRPPLLAVHTFAHRKSRFFTVVRTMCTRSSGCQPAVVRESRLGGQSAHIRSRSSHAAPRAAGVSPPWLGKRTCNADTAHVRGHSSRAKAGAAGVSPPWVGNRTCKNASAKSRVTAAGGRRTSVQLRL